MQTPKKISIRDFLVMREEWFDEHYVPVEVRMAEPNPSLQNL
jgi:hypothetical protein